MFTSKGSPKAAAHPNGTSYRQNVCVTIGVLLTPDTRERDREREFEVKGKRRMTMLVGTWRQVRRSVVITLSVSTLCEKEKRKRRKDGAQRNHQGNDWESKEETKEWCEREPLEKSQLWVWIHPNANQSFKHSRNSRGKEKSSSNTSAVCCFSFLECICTWEKVGVTCLPLGRRNRWPLPPHRHRPVDPEHGRYSGWFGWGSNKSMRTHAFNGFAVNAHARPSLLIQMIMLEKKQ